MSKLDGFILYAIITIILLSLIGGAYAYMNIWSNRRTVLKIFCAGSLKIPLDKVSELYKERYNVDIYIEAGGSIETIRKITDLGKSADILAVADYRLIPSYLYSEYADWYIGFASNQIVLVYTNRSKYLSELVTGNLSWYDVLSKNDVRWGFSDPNKDPCGYRAVGVIGLASLYYNEGIILNDLLLKNTNFQAKFENDSVEISVPSLINIKSNSLSIRPKSVDLIALLETGGLDYAFEYRSVAIQHGLGYIELPSKINLGDPSYDNFYSKVSVNILTGTDKEREISMVSIIYGITIPNTVMHRDLAVKFVELLLDDEGKKILRALGQAELDKLIYNGNIPPELEGYVNHD